MYKCSKMIEHESSVIQKPARVLSCDPNGLELSLCVFFHALLIGKTAKLSAWKKRLLNLLCQSCSSSISLGWCQISRIPCILRLLASHHYTASSLSPLVTLDICNHWPFNGNGAVWSLLLLLLTEVEYSLNLLLPEEMLRHTHTHLSHIHLHTFMIIRASQDCSYAVNSSTGVNSGQV